NKKKVQISAPSNFEHRVHTGFDHHEQKYVGLPPQWQGIVSNALDKGRPMPLVDPSEITPMDMLDMKMTHDVSRGQDSSSRLTRGFATLNLADPNRNPQTNMRGDRIPGNNNNNNSGSHGAANLPKTSSVARSNSLRSSSPPRLRRGEHWGGHNMPPTLHEGEILDGPPHHWPHAQYPNHPQGQPHHLSHPGLYAGHLSHQQGPPHHPPYHHPLGPTQPPKGSPGYMPQHRPSQNHGPMHSNPHGPHPLPGVPHGHSFNGDERWDHRDSRGPSHPDMRRDGWGAGAIRTPSGPSSAGSAGSSGQHGPTPPPPHHQNLHNGHPPHPQGGRPPAQLPLEAGGPGHPNGPPYPPHSHPASHHPHPSSSYPAPNHISHQQSNQHHHQQSNQHYHQPGQHPHQSPPQHRSHHRGLQPLPPPHQSPHSAGAPPPPLHHPPPSHHTSQSQLHMTQHQQPSQSAQHPQNSQEQQQNHPQHQPPPPPPHGMQKMQMHSPPHQYPPHGQPYPKLSKSISSCEWCEILGGLIYFSYKRVKYLLTLLYLTLEMKMYIGSYAPFQKTCVKLLTPA
ncbi:Serine/threonine-protein kinase PAK 7, partial [Halocaridina rubra]